MDEATESALRSATAWVEEALTPIEAIEACQQMSAAHSIQRWVIGASGSQPIEVYAFGAGELPVLVYALADAGDVVGGTLVVALMRAWVEGVGEWLELPVRWHVIPCLNFLDQRREDGTGRAMGVLADRLVDWCLDAPRAETEALVDYLEDVRPGLTVPMHGAHHGDAGGVMLGLSREVSRSVMDEARSWLEACGCGASQDVEHPTMGRGVYRLQEVVGEVWERTTYSVADRSGLVLICEPGRLVDARSVVAAQLGVVVSVVRSLVEEGRS